MPTPKKPTHLKLVTGNPGRRPLPKDEPKPKPSLPSVPAFLSRAAKAEWDRVAGLLNDLGMLTELDRSNLAAYCQCFSDWMEAEKRLRKYGKVVKSPIRTTVRRKGSEEVTETAGGYPMTSPFLAIRNRALEQMRQFGGLFGMSPVDRTRVSISHGPPPAKDISAKYF